MLGRGLCWTYLVLPVSQDFKEDPATKSTQVQHPWLKLRHCVIDAHAWQGHTGYSGPKVCHHIHSIALSHYIAET